MQAAALPIFTSDLLFSVPRQPRTSWSSCPNLAVGRRSQTSQLLEFFQRCTGGQAAGSLHAEVLFHAGTGLLPEKKDPAGPDWAGGAPPKDPKICLDLEKGRKFVDDLIGNSVEGKARNTAKKLSGFSKETREFVCFALVVHIQALEKAMSLSRKMHVHRLHPEQCSEGKVKVDDG